MSATFKDREESLQGRWANGSRATVNKKMPGMSKIQSQDFHQRMLVTIAPASAASALVFHGWPRNLQDEAR
jgi:hypothetical protein